MAQRLLNLMILAALVLASVYPAAARTGRPLSIDQQVDDLLAAMSPEEIVGQLFLVTFVGTDVSAESDVGRLVLDDHVGGVVLLSANDNLTDEAHMPQQLQRMTSALQQLGYDASLPPTPEPPGGSKEVTPPVYVPLFVAVDHEGDGSPFTRIRSGTTPLPNAMALGATWSRDDAEEIGRLTGLELEAMGVNMLLGPSLDVLDSPRPEGPGDLGTRSFGGDPYWVGVLGQSYIRGVHNGSSGRIAIVSKHFPGHGGSDRRTDDEVATVWRSLEQLKQIDLAPFVTVTTGAGGDPLSTTDALMTSHIRYQGFQGNIREFTRPISLDPVALETLMALPEFAAWRTNGGLIISDSLGVRAIKKFYAAQGYKEFPNRQVARDAFLAGNDMLLLSEFADSGDYQKQMASMEDTIQYFRDSYNSDSDFRARVDESVKRILRLKVLLYGDGDFTLEKVLPDEAKLAEVGRGRNQVFQAARDAITLVSPDARALHERIPNPPSRDDDIVIFTDVRESRQCSSCPERPLIAVDALQSAIVRLYGTSGQVDPARISSYSFTDLKTFLSVPVGGQPPPEAVTTTLTVQNALNNAEWVLFAMLDVVPDYPDSDALKLFLSQRPELASGRKVIAISYNAPYYLDTTEISKLTAYYAAYSKVEPYIDASVRAVFLELPPHGASPVSIDGVSYQLFEQTSPDPDQDIPISFVDAQGTPTPVQNVKVGDTLRVATGVILDHNGHAVPDNTPVRFRRVYALEGVELPSIVATTRNGVATADIPIEREGALEISAVSDPAVGKTKISITIIPGATSTVVIETPTFTPTPVPPTATNTPPPTASATSTPTPLSTAQPSDGGPRRVTWPDLLSALAGLAVLGTLGYWYAGVRSAAGTPAGGLRWALLCAAGGLLAYNAYALGLPGMDALRLWLSGWAVFAVTWAGGAAGLLVARWWESGGAR
jgi:beta-N-acetylhexosaminidase